MFGVGRGSEPDALRGRGTKGYCSRRGSQRNGLIVIAFEQAKLRPGAHAAVLEEFEQLAIALVNTTHQVRTAKFRVGQQNQAAAPPAGGTLDFAHIAVGTSAGAAQLFEKLSLEVG